MDTSLAVLPSEISKRHDIFLGYQIELKLPNESLNGVTDLFNICYRPACPPKCDQVRILFRCASRAVVLNCDFD